LEHVAVTEPFIGHHLETFCTKHHLNRPTNMEGNAVGYKGPYAKYDVTEPLLGGLRLLHN